MRIASVADLHGHLPALEAVVTDIGRRSRCRSPAGQWLLTLPYDHRSMASLARRNGRPDWAHALLCGYAS